MAYPDGADEVARTAVLAAARSFRLESGAAYRSRLEELEAVGLRAGHDVVDRALAWCTDQALDRSWESGWQPADVVRALRRVLSPRHATASGPAVAASAGRRPEAAADGRWAGQVAAIAAEAHRRPSYRAGASDLALGVESVSVLLHLPPLPKLSSPGGSGPAGRRKQGSAAMLERVRALLAKAESTTFPEEAESLTAKAQELMARHAVDAAMLDAGTAAGAADVAGWRIGVDEPYAAAKSMLLAGIAEANRCRAVWSAKLGFSTVFGDPSDLETTELLFTSLLVQGTDAMVRAGRAVDDGRSRTRSFRQSFLLAYATRIGERLAATTSSVVAEGAERHGDALLPVLAGRSEAVEEAVRVAFPKIVGRERRVSDYSGWVAGRAAADRASFSVGQSLPSG